MDSKGFTLIELVTAILIIVVLAAVAIPGFSVWLPKLRLKSAVRDLFNDLNMAKVHSLKEGDTRVAVKMDPNNDKYTIWLDEDSDWTTDVTEKIFIKVVIPQDPPDYETWERPRTEGIEIDSTTMDQNRFSFNSRGMPSADIPPPTSGNSYDIYMSHENDLHFMGVRISRAGSISIIKSQDGGATWTSD